MSSGIGEALRQARRQRGASLADAAAETRVRESYLAALEEEDFVALGGDVYVKGFLRSYARFLGLDPEPLLAEYRTAHERTDDGPSLAQAPAQPMVRERQPGIGLVAGGALVVLLLLVVLGLRGGDGDDVAGTLPPGPSEVTSEDARPLSSARPPSSAGAGMGDDPAEAAEELPESVELTFETVTGPSWMRVIVDGETVLEDTQPEGTSRTYTADEEISVRIGDPSAVVIVVNGEEQGRLGQAGVPVTVTYRARGAA